MDWITHILLFFDKYGIEGIAIILGSALICSIMYVVVKKFVSNIDSSINSGMENLAIKITDNITAQNDRLIDKHLDSKKLKNKRKNPAILVITGFSFMVEVTGFEPATFWSRTKRATKLRYTSSAWSQ